MFSRIRTGKSDWRSENIRLGSVFQPWKQARQLNQPRKDIENRK